MRDVLITFKKRNLGTRMRAIPTEWWFLLCVSLMLICFAVLNSGVVWEINVKSRMENMIEIK